METTLLIADASVLGILSPKVGTSEFEFFEFFHVHFMYLLVLSKEGMMRENSIRFILDFPNTPRTGRQGVRCLQAQTLQRSIFKQFAAGSQMSISSYQNQNQL